MNINFTNAFVYKNGEFTNTDFVFNAAEYSQKIAPLHSICGDVNFSNCYIFPGFIDVHVHFREPGFIYKESIATGSAAAAHGGYTDVCTMPNLNPVPDSDENLKVQLAAIEKNALISIYPYGAVTLGEKGKALSNMEEISNDVIAFSDDGKGIQDSDLMKAAMIKAKHLNKIISAHCEDNSLLNGGYINYSDYSILHGHKGISSESEWKQIKRDVEIAKETECKYHVCHISTKESVYIIADAKARGVDITCETAPHYLLLCDKDLQDDGRYKMNPPLRSEEDRLALIDGLKNGTIDMIATDHAPHSLIEKSGGLKDSLMGISGIETSFALLYTELVKKNIITLEKLIELMSINPSNRFNIKNSGFTVFSLDEKYKIASENFISNGKSTPFDGFEVFGKCKMTVCGGKIVWKEY